MDRRLVLEFVRVTEAAAISCFPQIGRGDEKAADAAAVAGMRAAFDRVPVRGTIVIGEGERDEAPMLYIGEKVGPHKDHLPEVDIAVDPLECTTVCATGRTGSLAVLAVAGAGDLLNAPDTYMHKIASGPEGKGVVSLRNTPTENVHALAEAKRVSVEDISVVVLDRPRHEDLIAELRNIGARLVLVSDGDVAPAVQVCMPDSGLDMLIGTGGAPEGVLGASALRCLGGMFEGQLAFRNEGERQRARDMGHGDPDRIFAHDELVSGDVIFVATGVTDGTLLKGVRNLQGRLRLHSLALRSATGTVRYVESWINADRLDGSEA